MNKSDLIERLALKKGMTRKRAESVVNIVFDAMTDALIKGDRIEIRGFGSFSVRQYGSYIGRDPRNGRSIKVAPKRLPYFKPSKKLLSELNGNSAETVEEYKESESSA